MTFVADRLKQMMDVRRVLIRCEHVKKGAHPSAKWAREKDDVLVCYECDRAIVEDAAFLSRIPQ